MRARPGQAGFTLTELIISSLISSILVIGVGMFMADVADTAGRAERMRVIKEDLMSSLMLLRWDIERGGSGIPYDMMAADVQEIEFEAATVDQVASYAVRTRDGTGANGSDELFLGGVGFDLSFAAQKAAVLTDDSTLLNTVTIPDNDGPGVNLVFNPADPDHFDPVVGEWLSVLDPLTGWRSLVPLQVSAVAAPAAGYLSVLTALGHVELPRASDLAFFHRSVPDDACAAGAPVFLPWHVQQVHWYLDTATDQLMRAVIADPTNAAGTTQAPIAVLNDVLDFQLAYLVWRCGDAAPTWVNSLYDHTTDSGEFSSGGCYNPWAVAYGVGDRFMAMRERLMAVRAGVLVRERLPIGDNAEEGGGAALNPQYDPGVPGQITLENNVNAGLDQTFRYHAIQQSFDPVNLRLKTPLSGGESYPQVRNQATALATYNSISGFYSGRQ